MSNEGDSDREPIDLTDVPAETPLSADEAIIRRHRREKRELQGKIQSMKKCITKNDKKRKKELADEIARLESELATKHKLELDTFRPGRMELGAGNEPSIAEEETKPEANSVPNSGDCGNEEVVELLPEAPGTPRMSKARKRREKKEALEKERRKRIDSENEQLLAESDLKTEEDKLNNLLGGLNLQVHDIPSDGHCLYKAISHQLEMNGECRSVQELRNLTASYLLSHQQQYLSFFDEAINDSLEGMENYCRAIESTAVWGGQVELRVLSDVLKKPIKIIQADGPPITFGDDFEGNTLTLSFHRHQFTLGAHYNSVVSKD